VTNADRPRRIIHDAKAWQEGFAAGRRGLRWNTNPYAPGSDASLGWYSGLVEGRAKPLRLVADRSPGRPNR
jgi:hypothetical protein